ncbi:MAG: beta-CASP ribonuclease aCPSF1 [Thermoplasmatota archaeon]
MASVEDMLRDLRVQVDKILPRDVDCSDLDFEAHELVLTTKTPQAFAQNPGLIPQLAKALQKRIVVRPDVGVLPPAEEAEAKLAHIIPPEAGLKACYWNESNGEVVLEVERPGMAIGQKGATLNQIRNEILWTPKVVRAPPIPSKTVKQLREYMRQVGEERKTFLRRVGRRMHRSASPGEPWVRMTALGAWREVGRSCAMLQTQDSKVLIDCGVKFDEGDPATPFFWLGEVQPFDSLDAVVLTHGHLDHCGLLPLLFKYGYEGPVYCTTPTRDLMALLTMDYIKVAQAQGQKKPYDAEDVRKAIRHCITIDWGETTDVAPDLKLTYHDAGHILGSSTAHFHVGNGLYNVAFSGDIKYERSWLFNPATNKFPRVDAVICESTYGGRDNFQPTRQMAQEQTREIVKKTINEKKGKVVFPVFAVGRSQEVMLVLEELLREGAIPKDTNVYLDGMIWEATAIHTCYPEYLNNGLKQRIFNENDNPLLAPQFKRVDSWEMRQTVCGDPDPCIVLATSGMLTGGPVLEYMKHWADDAKNTLCFVGFNAEGSLGRKLQRGWREMPIREGTEHKSIRVEMDIETIDGYSGHCDRRQLMNYIQNMEPKPKLVLTGHGEASKCIDFAESITEKFGIEARSMQNAETVRFV